MQGFPQVCGLGMEAFLWLHKSTESPRGPVCQYQEGHCVQPSRSIVVCVCLAWRSPLYQQRPTTERGDNVISWICLLSVCLSLSCASGCLSGCVCWHRHRIPISLWAFKHLYLFYFSLPSWLLSLHPRPSSLSLVVIFFLFNLPRPVEHFEHFVKQRDEGLREGGREETGWVEFHTPYISALILRHPRQVPALGWLRRLST